MHVRVARFEGIETSTIDETYEQFRSTVRMKERPEWMDETVFQTLRDDVKRVLSLADREAGVSLDMTFTESAEAARRVHDALDSLTPPDGSGRRVSVATYEVMLDEQLG